MHNLLSISFYSVLSQFIVFILIFNSSSCANNPTNGGGTERGPSTEPGGIHILESGLSFEIALPTDYDTTKTYPVLLLNDGETVFGSGIWNLDGLIAALIKDEKIEPIITIAIHANGNRNNWYIPYQDPWVTQNWGPYTPMAHEYANLIMEDLLPHLEEEYSIDVNNIGIMGYSLGGLISTWMGLKYPDKIKYSASLSGSFWVADYKIFEEVQGSYENDQKFWFDIGTSEWNYYVPLYKNLQIADVIPGKRSFYYEVPGGAHTANDWKKRIHYPILLFYGTSEIKPISMEVVLECIPSQSDPTKKFRRMNPIITLSNDVKYSLAQTADYSVQSGDIHLGSEGSLLNNADFESKVSVAFEGFSEEVTIPKGWCR